MAWIRACGGGSPAVPDGRTVTPINNVTIWQQCAGIANPTYTTLGEILADTGILQTLMASDNAVDYLVRCKAFAGLGLVPAMTSDTTPSGECSANSTQSIYYPWKAFDGDYASDAKGWVPRSGVPVFYTNDYIRYHFAYPASVKRAKVAYCLRGTVNTLKFKIQGSNDGNTWTDLCLEQTFVANTTNTINYYNVSLNNGTYEYLQLIMTANSTTDGGVGLKLQFFDADANICDNSNAMYYIGQNNYASNTLLADSDWREAICNSAYFESVLNVKVPTMTSNNTPSGVASANSQSGNAYKAFDNNASSSWSSDLGSNTWVQYLFAQSCMVCKVLIHADYTSAGSRLKNFSIQASADGNTWDTLQSDTYANSDTDQVFVISNQTSYEYYRLFCNDLYVSGWGIGIKTLQFYGREDV